MEYFIGQILPDYIGRNDALQFDMTDNGSFLTISLRNPTNKELRAFFNPTTEIRLTCFSKCIWLTFKFGHLGWMDAPYTPYLSDNLTIPNGLDKACSGFTIMLIDTSDGRILYLGQVDFSYEFTVAMKLSVLAMTKFPFDKYDYDLWLSNMQNRFTPEEIAAKAIANFSAGS